MEAHHQASSSSSSSSAADSKSYEVFLSFYGLDVRKNFADNLYESLVYAGIRTFRDEDELQKGKVIRSELLAAVQQSRISIPILSENYASSKWCLDELLEISKCRRTRDQMIMPIFYKVEPKDVRNQTGIYAKAFEEHHETNNETTVQKWKTALRDVGELSGWHSKEETYEGKLIKEIVKRVWSTLSKRSLAVSTNLVGIESHIKKMLMLLNIESANTKFVGIHGIGGIGKTTIARAVCNTISHHFEGYSFIENIKENAQKHGLPHLQNQLIFDILKQKNKNMTSVDDGIKVIQQRFCQKKVLIVLDDVDQDNQAKSLVGYHEWLGIGSKVVITSRNKDILIAQKVDGIYEQSVMDLYGSLELFSHHAFGRDWPLEDYWDLSKAIVETTGGLPLALKVIGSSLNLKRKSIWEDMLKKLRKIPNKDVMESLKISYDGLEYEEQQIFLDIACFFIGMNKDIACQIWDGCGFAPQLGLDALCVRSLVTISENGELRLHDLLRDLGREIVRQESIEEPGKRTRIWSQEDVLEVLDEQTGTTKVKGLSIDFRSRSENERLMSGEGFGSMKKLRLLQLDYAHFSGNFANYFSELRWLSWKGCHDEDAQATFHLKKLVVLDLSHSMITDKWIGWNFIKMAAANLKVLNLMDCHQLSSTPDFSANQPLEVLILKCCENLVKIDTSIDKLIHLVTLDMSGCELLVDLPFEIRRLTSLKTLDLNHCISLESLPILPRNLEVLILNYCVNLVEINTSIGYLDNLVTLDLGRCKSLVDLPFEIYQLTSLKTLDLSVCEKLKSLPDLPGNLEVLNLSYCSNLVEINKSIGYLRKLVTLNMCYCWSLQDLPIEVCNLTSLVSLNLSNCENLNKLPKELGRMTTLETLDLSGCQFLVDLPNEICQLTSLKCLNLYNCKRLNKLPEKLGELISLTTLLVSCCETLVDLPMLSNLKNLKGMCLKRLEKLLHISNLPLSLTSLKVISCSSIPYISGLPSSLTSLGVMECNSIRYISGIPSSLTTLDVERCNSMKKLSSTSGLRNLERLHLERCDSLEEIEGVDDDKGLDSLVVFRMRGSSLKELPNMSNSKDLRELEIDECPKLSKIESLEGCKSLETLQVSWAKSLKILPADVSTLKNLSKLRIIGCDLMERLPDISNFNKLKELWISRCMELSIIPCLDRLESLQELTIAGCAIERLPDLSNLKKLIGLRIENSEKLTEIHGLDRLELLERLNICGCESLERLPDLSNLKILTELRMKNCKKLTKILGLDRLEFLERLNISGCKSLERLPDLSNLKKLKWLYAKDCKKLTEIKAVNGLESLEHLEV